MSKVPTGEYLDNLRARITNIEKWVQRYDPNFKVVAVPKEQRYVKVLLDDSVERDFLKAYTYEDCEDAPLVKGERVRVPVRYGSDLTGTVIATGPKVQPSGLYTVRVVSERL